MPNLFTLLILLCSLGLIANVHAADEIKTVQLYSQDELIALINRNEHLGRVVLDNCQLIQDIEARAHTLKIPAYQFLWGDMLAWGVCVPAEPDRGIEYMRHAAAQGLPAGLEQLGRYYVQGKFVQQDKKRAVVYLREASQLGHLAAQIQLAELYIEGFGSPYDYEDVYHWLYNAITRDQATQDKIADCMAALGELMPPKIVRKARRTSDF